MSSQIQIKRTLKDYQSDADKLIEIYLSDNNREYLTTDILKDYLQIQNYQPKEVDLLIGLIRRTSTSVLDPYASPKFKQKLNEDGDEQKLQLLRDLAPFGNDPDYQYEVDNTYVKSIQKFREAERWAMKEEYLTQERTINGRKKGQIGAFLRKLMELDVIKKPKGKLKLQAIDDYFSERYQIKGGLGDNLKPNKSATHIREFIELEYAVNKTE